MQWRLSEQSVVTRVRGRQVPAALCALCEQAAARHAEALGVSLERLQTEGLSWVLARLLLEIEAMPHEGEPITVTTWPVRVEKAQFRRDYLLQTENGPCGRGSSEWCVINLSTRRLEMPPSLGTILQPPHAEEAVSGVWARIIRPGSEAPVVFSVKASENDVDVNGHVNNMRLVDWLLDALAATGADVSRLSFLDVMFRAEALAGDSIEARALVGNVECIVPNGADVPQCAVNISLFRQAEGRELVRARLGWIDGRGGA